MRHTVRALVLLVAAALFYTVTAANAQDLTVSIDTVRRTGNPACDPADFCSVTARLPVPDGLVGLSCTVTATSSNNDSVHPGNDLVVQSWNGSADEVRITDVESASFVTGSASGRLELGDWWQVFVDIGPDNVFSGGLTVDVSDCVDQTTTTTTAPTTTVPETTTTTEVPPSTTLPPTTTTPTLPTTTTTTPITTTSTSIPTTTVTAPPTTSTPATTSTTQPIGTTEPPSTPTTEITQQTTERDLPNTGIPTYVLAAVGFVAVTTGATLIRFTKEET